jgi:hypothetical protein
MALPQSYPLYDIQCTACAFRAQIKTLRSRPATRIRGAGWEVLDKVLKSGFLVPPLIVNWIWTVGGKTNREIRLYPFIPRRSLHSYALSATARRPNYKMFDYKGMQRLPSLVLYKKPRGERG